MMRLIDKVAEARTPKEALAAFRDWLEDAGMPVAAMAAHREMTDVAPREFEIMRSWEVERDALEAAAEVDDRYDEGHEDGYEEGWQACLAASKGALLIAEQVSEVKPL